MKIIKGIGTICLRLISLVFLSVVVLIALFRQYLQFCWQYLCYGGECIAYGHKNSKKSISDVYELLEKRILPKQQK